MAVSQICVPGNCQFAGRGQPRVSEERSVSDWLFIYVVLVDSTTPTPLQHTENISIQLDMLISVLFKARSFPLSALQCQRSSGAVNWLMTRTPRATASSLIYTWGQRWMIHGLQEGNRDILQLYALLVCLFFSQMCTSLSKPWDTFLCVIRSELHNLPDCFSSLCPPPISPSVSALWTPSIFACSVHWLPEHFVFSSHYNAMLILNVAPTVPDENEWPYLSVSISPSIIGDFFFWGGGVRIHGGGGWYKIRLSYLNAISSTIWLAVRTQWPLIC